MPGHRKAVVTSKTYASEDLFLQLAKAMNRIVSKNGEEYIENPY